MSFGLGRASLLGVKLRTRKLGVCSLIALAVTLPLSPEDAVASDKAPTSSVASAKVELAAAPSTLISVSAAPVLTPVAAEPVQPTRAIIVGSASSEHSRAAIRTWQALGVAQHSAAVFDAWSTRQALLSGNGYERDPLMKPFAKSAVIYPATQVAPLLFDFFGYRMMKSQNRYLRRTWWLPQAASLVGSAWCGSRNLRVASLKR